MKIITHCVVVVTVVTMWGENLLAPGQYFRDALKKAIK